MLKEIMEQREALGRALNQPAALVQTVARAMRVAENLFFAGCGTAGKVALRSMISPPRLGLRGVRARWPRCAPCNGIHESGTVLGYVAIMRALQVLEGEGNVLDGQSS